jgi:hypothetical protein
MMIDISDCDRLYPSVYEFLPGQPAEMVDTNSKPFVGNASMIELSLLLGKVLKLLYTPCKSRFLVRLLSLSSLD